MIYLSIGFVSVIGTHADLNCTTRTRSTCGELDCGLGLRRRRFSFMRNRSTGYVWGMSRVDSAVGSALHGFTHVVGFGTAENPRHVRLDMQLQARQAGSL